MKRPWIVLLTASIALPVFAAVTDAQKQRFSTLAGLKKLEREMELRDLRRRYPEVSRYSEELTDSALRKLSDRDLSELHAHVYTVYGTNTITVIAAAVHAFQDMSSSVAAIIYMPVLVADPATGNYQVRAPTSEALGACPVKGSFTSEPAAAVCTGFLFGKSDVLLTSGHCVPPADLPFLRFVFDYKLDRKGSLVISPTNVFEADSVIDRLDSNIGAEWVLVKLKTDTQRTPLQPPSTGTSVTKGMKVSVVGCPGGGTLRSATDAVVRDVQRETFVAALDVFAGNSGSPVLTDDGTALLGILTRGEDDWVPDVAQGCMTMKLCRDENKDCIGETVTSIAIVPVPK